MRGKVRYRLATPEDAADLSRLYAYNILPDIDNPVSSMAEDINSIDGDTLVAYMGERIAAGITISQFLARQDLYPDWWIFNLFVRFRYRGMGIGEDLSLLCVERAREFSAKQINLLVYEDNKAANNLYSKLGFRQTFFPKLEKRLEKEAISTDRRRIIMSRPI